MVGMEASCAFVKWNSELARVVSAKKKLLRWCPLHINKPRRKILLLTFAALLFADVTGVLKIVEGEDVLHLSLCVDD